MRVLPFEPMHMDRMATRKHHTRHYSHGFDLAAQVVYFARLGPAFTLEHGGILIGSAGVVRKCAGVGEAWAVTSEAIHRYPLATVKAVRWWLERILEVEDLHRLEVSCLADFEPGLKFIESIGFPRETRVLLEQALPDKSDLYLYARLRETTGRDFPSPLPRPSSDKGPLILSPYKHAANNMHNPSNNHISIHANNAAPTTAARNLHRR